MAAERAIQAAQSQPKTAQGLHAALSIEDLQRAAQQRLPASIYGYVSGGSEDLQTVAANRAAFQRWSFVPRPLVDVAKRSQSLDVLGSRYQTPVGIAPIGVAALCHFDGDRALASAAYQAGQIFVLSAASTTPLEQVAQANPEMWFQAYLPADYTVIGALLERLKAAAIKVLVLTVDVQLAATRENELRNGFSVPLRPNARLIAGGLLRPRWLVQTFAHTLLKTGVPHFENFTASCGGPIIQATKGDHRAGRAAFTWEYVRWIRAHWSGGLLIKGLLRASDALQAQREGVDGIVVSNHGGRQLDGTVASLDALPAMVGAAPDLTFVLDGGVRRGTDVLKALALGAHAVLVGRPAMYGLAAGGQAGALHALHLLKQEVDVDMALLGCADIRDLSMDFLHRTAEPLPMLRSQASNEKD